MEDSGNLSDKSEGNNWSCCIKWCWLFYNAMLIHPRVIPKTLQF